MGMRQCPKRLWLDVHAPDRRQDSEYAKAKFAVGDLVGALARVLYDDEGTGVLIDVMRDGVELALEKTAQAMARRIPIFEAGFEAAGGRAFVDILLPSKKGSGRSWDLIEVKSSTSPRAVHRDDIAIQAYVLLAAGIPMGRVKLAYVDKSFIYRGQDQYQGLLREMDVTTEVLERQPEVERWIASGQEIAASSLPPKVFTGVQCRTPYPCGYLHHCRTEDEPVDFPVDHLPQIQGGLRQLLSERGIRDMRDIPDEMLSERQRLIRSSTVNQAVFFDEESIAQALDRIEVPVSYLDFEAVQLPVPIWEGTRPYQTLPFQWSLHTPDGAGGYQHIDYVDLSGAEPSAGFIDALLKAVPSTGSILVWNAHVEKTVLDSLARRHSLHAKALRQISSRIVDLALIVEAGFYHPRQRGSYKLKRVLPAVAPALDYANLEGVQDGYMALMAYVEAIQEDIDPSRKVAIEHSLKKYCQRDSLALKTIHEGLGRYLDERRDGPARLGAGLD
jgi:hypothetical protein